MSRCPRTARRAGSGGRGACRRLGGGGVSGGFGVRRGRGVRRRVFFFVRCCYEPVLAGVFVQFRVVAGLKGHFALVVGGRRDGVGE